MTDILVFAMQSHFGTRIYDAYCTL